MEGRNQNYIGRKGEVAPVKRISYLYGDHLSPKVGALGVQRSRLNDECGGLLCAVWKAISNVHYPIDLFNRRYTMLLTT